MQFLVPDSDTIQSLEVNMLTLAYSALPDFYVIPRGYLTFTNIPARLDISALIVLRKLSLVLLELIAINLVLPVLSIVWSVSLGIFVLLQLLFILNVLKVTTALLDLQILQFVLLAFSAARIPQSLKYALKITIALRELFCHM